VTVKDNQYIAVAYLGGEKSGPIQVYGADEEAEAGQVETYEFKIDSVEPHIYLLIADYAANETMYKINLNTDELSDPVNIELDQEEYHVLKNSQVQAYATITPWSIDESCEWTIEDESIATVDQNGVITGVTVGETTLTVKALAGDQPSASAKVVVDEINKNLNAVIWDENGEIWFTGFNVSKIPEYEKISDSMQAALTYISQNLTAKISLSDIAASAYMSPSYFQKKFKKCFNGISPANYILKKRIEYSKGVICDNSLSMERIAEICGFSSRAYFDVCFKKETGVTPAAYRKLLNKGMF
jgi:AraC-like DNA-binding protein